MDYEAPLMPCGCILLHLPHIPGTGLCPEPRERARPLWPPCGPLLGVWASAAALGFSQATAKAAGAHAAKLRGGWESSWVPGDTGGCWDRGVPGPTPLVG